jgi:hypothetical protein
MACFVQRTRRCGGECKAVRFAQQGGCMKARFKSALNSKPLLKYGLLTAGSGLWLYGLVEQFYSSAEIMKYLLMSLLIAVVAVI